MKTRRWLLAAEILVLSLTAVFLFLALRGNHPLSSGIREYILENGREETGALNLVTAIYLGYRAFDTLGETIVLLLAVSGVLYFVDIFRKDRDLEKDDNS
jgi:multicomponent Na+:H+ antiporter subunit B